MHEMRQMVGSLLSEREQTTQAQGAVEQFEAQHAHWLYQTNPQTGQQVATQQGQAFFETVQDLQANGMTDQAKILEVASRMHGITSQQQPAQPAPAQPPAQAQAPAPTQPVPNQPVPVQQPAAPTSAPVAQQPVAQPAQPAQTFLDSAKQRAMHSPPAATGFTPDQPQSVTEGDLETMFTSAAQSASVS